MHVSQLLVVLAAALGPAAAALSPSQQPGRDDLNAHKHAHAVHTESARVRRDEATPCTASYGAGYEPCGTPVVGMPLSCYNPSEGQTCCQDGGYCAQGQYCSATPQRCCAEGSSEDDCSHSATSTLRVQARDFAASGSLPGSMSMSMGMGAMGERYGVDADAVTTTRAENALYADGYEPALNSPELALRSGSAPKTAPAVAWSTLSALGVALFMATR